MAIDKTRLNQTNPDVLSYLSDPTTTDLADGIGLFLVPEPEVSATSAKRIIVENISYEECIKRGEYTFGFKWFPKSMFNREGLILACGQDCDQRPCPGFCICNLTILRCQA